MQWSATELYTALGTANLPSLGPLVRGRWDKKRQTNLTKPIDNNSSHSREINTPFASKSHVTEIRIIESCDGHKGFRVLDEESDYNVALREYAA